MKLRTNPEQGIKKKQRRDYIATGINNGIKKIIKAKVQDGDEDFEYDFSLYDDGEENNVEEFDESKYDHQPMISGIKSRYSNWVSELDRLAQINSLTTKYAILVESRTQEIEALWKFYGVLNEFWASIQSVYGRWTINKINKIKARCRYLLDQDWDNGIDPKVHNNLLYYRIELYKLRQFGGLGFDVEHRSRSYGERARQSIVQ